ncbi:type VI secretion system contractile sheath small subunit [Sulfidibacter corallicola]|uniref:Type VI secretion system contractile sheath small subunit n=1 Tax=Sulfidibacter corallicola TaxID=2818388 RepID=A0A8A4TP47_SULCO|nr:type VI secretion system contractile sheath small subunit [Sulfidibacter corallicola]QTD50974.1 type VI secretion system contractile sheath small subunit [Sulfidibacter corallicola]
MSQSTQHKIGRVRPPRVQITYDVEVGENTEVKELPFVAGIMADLSGEPKEPLPPLKKRKFVEIDGENFDKVLAASDPHLSFRVDDVLTGNGKLDVELDFAELEDFSPTRVVSQVPALAKLLEARIRLKDLISKLDGNEDLDGLLQEVLNNSEEREALKQQLGGSDD